MTAEQSPGALCTEAEAKAIAASAMKRHETVEIDGIRMPRGWTAFKPKNEEI